MSKKIRESVSALIDGEAGELELRRLLALSSDDDVAEVNKAWVDYHRCRNVMQSDTASSGFEQWDIAGQVSAAIREDHAVSSSVLQQWLRPVASLAVAATVAFVVVIGMQSGGSSVNNGSNQAAAPLAQVSPQSVSNSSRVYPVQGQSMQASKGTGATVAYASTELPGSTALSKAEANEEAKKRLDRFLLRHTENAALNNGQGVMSFARVASFETE